MTKPIEELEKQLQELTGELVMKALVKIKKEEQDDCIKKMMIKAADEIYAFYFGMIGEEDLKYSNPEDFIKIKMCEVEIERILREKAGIKCNKDFYKRIFQQEEQQDD